MKKRCLFFCSLTVIISLLILPGCGKVKQQSYLDEPKSVEQVGEVPTEFQEIIENNLFKDAAAFTDRLLKSETIPLDVEDRTVTYRIKMMDIYGGELAAYTVSCEDTYHPTTLTATNDGGFLFVLYFEERYLIEEELWASEKGVASRVIKCDKDGNLQFDTPLDGIEGHSLRYCFEMNDRFYFFGDIETPETNTLGVYSRTDVFMAILDNKGQLLENKVIAGSDFDNLDVAEMNGDSIVLSVSSQSDDGDFAGSNSGGYPKEWVITVDGALEIVEKRKESGREYADDKIGEKDGVAVFGTDKLFKKYDLYDPNVFIDYGDFYLILSENRTGKYENQPPFISSTWYYTETVYSAYNYNGRLLFRASVDSSPDYDARIQELNNQS